VTHENVEAARKPFLSNYCYPGALLGAPTLLGIFGTVCKMRSFHYGISVIIGA
jgi:hypothetical protein